MSGWFGELMHFVLVDVEWKLLSDDCKRVTFFNGCECSVIDQMFS